MGGYFSPHRLKGYYIQKLYHMAWGYPPFLKAIIAIAVLVKVTEKIFVEFLLTIFVPHTIKAFLHSHHTQHFSDNLL